MISVCLLFSFIVGIFNLKCLAFTIEELNAIQYEVNVLKYPLKNMGEQHFSLVPMTSKSGKEYECYIPKPNESLSESDSKNGKSIDIQKLLEPMYEGSCLYKIKDWWTYELCFGKAIKQFHIEDGRIAGEILTLGLYELDNKWEDEFYEEKFERVKPHHAQSYVNGTKCDLTGLPRNTEVKIFCEEDSLDYINWITEPETCNYVITVHTSLLCSHPLFKSSKELHTIVCQPSGID